MVRDRPGHIQKTTVMPNLSKEFLFTTSRNLTPKVEGQYTSAGCAIAKGRCAMGLTPFAELAQISRTIGTDISPSALGRGPRSGGRAWPGMAFSAGYFQCLAAYRYNNIWPIQTTTRSCYRDVLTTPPSVGIE